MQNLPDTVGKMFVFNTYQPSLEKIQFQNITGLQKLHKNYDSTSIFFCDRLSENFQWVQHNAQWCF